MSASKKIGKERTYEQVGDQLGISPQQVHKIEKEAINKIIRRLNNFGQFNIFDIVVGLSEEFGVDPSQIYSKLDEENAETLKEHVYKIYGKKAEGFSPFSKKSSADIDDLFA